MWIHWLEYRVGKLPTKGRIVNILGFASHIGCLMHFWFFFFLNNFIYLFIYLFIYFWLFWVFSAVQAFLCLWWAGAMLHNSVQTSHCGGFSCWGAQALGAWASAADSWGFQAHSTGSIVVGWVASQHVGSPQARDRTCLSCTGRWILYQWANRKALFSFF